MYFESSLVYLDYLWFTCKQQENNNIHTKIVMALTSCDNTVITYRWKKRELTHHIESYQTHCRVPIVVFLYFC